MFDYPRNAGLKSSEYVQLGRLVNAGWKHRKFTFGAFLAAFGLVFTAYCLAVPKYEATALLLVGQNALDGPSDGTGSASEISASMIRIVESEDVIRQAVEKVGLGKVVEPRNNSILAGFLKLSSIGGLFSFRRTDPIGEISDLDRAIPIIESALEVKREGNSNVIRISFRHKDRIIAVDFVNAIVDSFIDRQLSILGRSRAADFYQDKKDRFDKEIQQASNALGSFETTNTIYSIAEERQLLLKQKSDSSSGLAITRGLIAEKTGQKRSLATQLRLLKQVTQSPFVSSVVTKLSGNDPSPGGSERTAAESNARTDENHVSETPPFLMVRVYQEAMLSLFKVNSELTGLSNLERAQTEELQLLNDKLDKLSSKEAEFAKLKRNLEQASFNSDIYTRRMVEERTSAESAAAKFSTVKVVQQAYAPLKPVTPNPRLFYGIGLGAGVLASIAAAWFFRTITENTDKPSKAESAPASDQETIRSDDQNPLVKRRREVRRRTPATTKVAKPAARPPEPGRA